VTEESGTAITLATAALLSVLLVTAGCVSGQTETTTEQPSLSASDIGDRLASEMNVTHVDVADNGFGHHIVVYPNSADNCYVLGTIHTLTDELETIEQRQDLGFVSVDYAVGNEIMTMHVNESMFQQRFNGIWNTTEFAVQIVETASVRTINGTTTEVKS